LKPLWGRPGRGCTYTTDAEFKGSIFYRSSLYRRVVRPYRWMAKRATRACCDHHTERSLQLDGSQDDRITQLVIHQQQPESQELLLVAALALVRTQRRGPGWPHMHSCEAGLSQRHPTPTLARYHTTARTWQQLQLRRRRHSTTQLNPFRRAGLAHVTRGGMIYQHQAISRVATDACAEGGGASEGSDVFR
jgi:hypothetical protein